MLDQSQFIELEDKQNKCNSTEIYLGNGKKNHFLEKD